MPVNIGGIIQNDWEISCQPKGYSDHHNPELFSIETAEMFRHFGCGAIFEETNGDEVTAIPGVGTVEPEWVQEKGKNAGTNVLDLKTNANMLTNL
jgi:hypothetical protein